MTENEQSGSNPSEIPNVEQLAPNDAPSQVPGNNGIIYVLENEAFETSVIKIGRTGSDLAARIRTLNTAVPLPFTCYRASRVADAQHVERLLHDVFDPAKRHWRGEFFEVEPWRVVLVLGQYEIEDVTHLAPIPSTDEEVSIDTVVQAKDRKASATFASLGIDVGEKLSLVGQPGIQCEVADDQTTVLYEGQEFALSTLATRLKDSKHWLQGLRHWVYEEETLLKRRDRMLGV